jgi:hypothetical protein
MTDVCAAGAAILSNAGARLNTRKERAASKLVMSREIFDSLPTVSCDDIEASRGSCWVKTLTGDYWYAVDQQGKYKLIEIRAYVRED